MKKVLMMAACAVLVTGVANAGDVALSLVNSAGASTDTVTAGTATYTLEVRALVTPTAGEGGLALFGFDFDGPVTLASNQFTTALTSFVKNEGLTNPAGFGGTLSGSTLLQVGGGQNTIGYTGTSPAYPTGTVVAGIGLTEATIATIVLDTSALAAGDHVFQISNGFANLIEPASQPSAPPYTVSAANMLAGSPTFTLTIGDTTPPEITSSWYSWKNHGTTLGDLGREFPQTPQTFAPIETRAGSVTQLTFTFNKAIDPATFTPAAVTICGYVNTPPAPATATLDGTGTQATLTWAAGAIPNGFQKASVHDHYVVCIGSSVQDTEGNALAGDRDVNFAASFGNVRFENLGNWRAVDSLDRTLLAQNYTTTPTPEQAVNFDIRIDGGNAGRINSLDRTQLGQSYTPSSAEWLIQTPPACSCP